MSANTTDMLQFYREQSAVTNPRDYAYLFDTLPTDIIEISKVLQNILLHNWKTYAENMQLTEQRRAEIEIRPIARLLARIQEVDTQPWSEEHPVDKRVVIDCRHFATLLCSILRHRGVPTRTRHGFAAYLMPGHKQSHVICEYWDEAQQRWIGADADTVQVDIAADRFLTAGDAWQRCRRGEMDPLELGYAPDARGLWCARWEIVRDLAALNKQEMLTFDVWGLNETYEYNADLSAEDTELLDRIASMHAAEQQHFAELRSIYLEDERVRVPAVAKSQPYTTGLTHMIDLKQEGSMDS